MTQGWGQGFRAIGFRAEGDLRKLQARADAAAELEGCLLAYRQGMAYLFFG